MPEEMYKDDILSRMKALDQHANLEFDGSGRFHVIIVGGGALILHENFERKYRPCKD